MQCKNALHKNTTATYPHRTYNTMYYDEFVVFV